jgi:hypothetical protein
MNIEFSMGPNDSARRLDKPEIRNIVIVGGFSNDPDGNMFSLDPLEIDKHLGRLQPSATVHIGDQDIELSFGQMDDFHPDALLKRLPEFDAPLVAEAKTPPPASSDDSEDSGDDMFERLLGKPKSAAGSASPTVKSTVDRLLADAVGSDNAPPRESAATRSERDAWYTAILRETLGSRSLQRVESNWLSLAWLGEQLDYDEETGLWVVDADTADIRGLAERLPGQVAAGPGAVHSIVVLREFGDTDDDRAELAELSKLAAALNAKAFAAAAPDAAGLSGNLDSPERHTACLVDRVPGFSWFLATPAVRQVERPNRQL